MFRNVLAATLRNLMRNRLYAGITILGLAVAFAAAALISLFVADDYAYDRFIPGYQAVLRLDMVQHAPGAAPQATDMSLTSAAALLKLDFPQIAAVARISPSQGGVRRGDVEALDQITWADPAVFSVLPLPVLAGDIKTALDTPDAVVLTRGMARKYFGEDRPLGKTIEINPALSNLPGLSKAEAERLGSFHPMRVTAVIDDLPSNTHLKADIFAAATAPFSPMKRWEEQPDSVEVHTYLRLKPPGQAEDVRRGLDAFLARHYPPAPSARAAWALHLTPLADIHLAPPASNSLKPRGDKMVDAGIVVVGGLIVLVAAINFVTLMTARTSRRAVEVGVRKVAGARRADLVVQFIGEALIYVALAMIAGLSLAEIALPFLDAWLQRTLRPDELGAAVWLVVPGLTLAVGLAAGFYPALLLSAFRPASVMKAGQAGLGGAAGARRVLVVAQFAIMVALLIAAATIYRQTTFALKNSLELDTDGVVSVFTPCSDAIKHEAMALRGVASAACTSSIAMNRRSAPAPASRANGTASMVQAAPIDVGFLELHGQKPVAGRFFSRDQGLDMALANPGAGAVAQPNVILNQSAARRLGFASPQAAIGQTVSWARRDAGGHTNTPLALRPSQVVGVVQDFTMGSIRRPIDATLYYVDPKLMLFVDVKLNGRDTLPTLNALDAAVKRTAGRDKPVQRTFQSQSLQALYKDVIAQAVVIAVCTGLAVLIAGLGMFALSAFTAERRTKEIGVRRVMGASQADTLRLLIWEFTKPVLWASLIAWPLGWWAMTRWLEGFAYRAALPLWLFPVATAGALTIAWITVSTHAVMAARARPVAALRYE